MTTGGVAQVAMDAFSAWVQDGTDGLNARLALYRTSNSLATTDAPDIKTFSEDLHLPSVDVNFPYLSMVIPGHSGEVDGLSRTYDVDLEVAVVVVEANTGKNALRGPVKAVRRIMDVLGDMFSAFTATRDGQFLNAEQAPLIVWSRPGAVRFGVDEDAPGGAKHGNHAGLMPVTIRVQRPYPVESY